MLSLLPKKDGDILRVSVRAYSKYLEKTHTLKANEDVTHSLSVLLYDTLSELTSYTLPWGILYGVRPARLMHSTAEKLGIDGAVNKFLSDKVEKRE